MSDQFAVEVFVGGTTVEVLSGGTSLVEIDGGGGGSGSSGSSLVDRLFTDTSPGAAITVNMDNSDVFEYTFDTDDTEITLFCTDPGAGNCRSVLIKMRVGAVPVTSPIWTNVSSFDGPGLPPELLSNAETWITAVATAYHDGSFEVMAGTDVPTTQPMWLPYSVWDFPLATSGFPTPKYIKSTGTVRANTVAAQTRAFAFNKDTDQVILTEVTWPNAYVHSGTLRFRMAADPILGDVVWKAAPARIVDLSTNIASANEMFDVASLSGTLTVPGTSMQEREVTITIGSVPFTPGAPAYIMLGRDADNASDTCAGDAYIIPPVTFEWVGF